MIRQARTGDTVFVKSGEMTGRTQTLPWWLRGIRGKDDRKLNTLAPLTNTYLIVKSKYSNTYYCIALQYVDCRKSFQ